MDKKKSQHFNFGNEVIPVMFHSQTKDFMKYLERDGLKFLQFWWDHVGTQLKEEQLVPFTGMDYKITPIDAVTNLVIITLPVPHADGELYFLGMISKPERRFAWVKFTTTRVIALARQPKSVDPHGAELIELTAQAHIVKFKESIAPSKDEFTKLMLNLARKKQAGR